MNTALFCLQVAAFDSLFEVHVFVVVSKCVLKYWIMFLLQNWSCFAGSEEIFADFVKLCGDSLVVHLV